MASPDPRNTSRDDSEGDGVFFQTQPSPAEHTGGGTRTPPSWARSSNSLIGEDLLTNSRPSVGQTSRSLDVTPVLSPSEATTPPDSMISYGLSSLSPPPLNHEAVSWSSVNAPIQQRRPPRAPNVNLRFSSASVGGGIPGAAKQHPPAHLHHHHKREMSTGDVSFLSGLTDTDFEASSNGGGGAMEDEMNLDVLQQPILDDNDEDDDTPGMNNSPIAQGLKAIGEKDVLPEQTASRARKDVFVTPERERKTSIFVGNESPGRAGRNHHRRLKRICEFETEAETLILNAIEEQTAIDARRESVKDLIYPGVPDDLASRFDDEQEEGSEHEVVVESRRPSLKRSESVFARAAVQLEALKEVRATAAARTSPVRKQAATDMFIDNAEALMNNRTRAKNRNKSVHSMHAMPDSIANEEVSRASEGEQEQSSKTGDIETGSALPARPRHKKFRIFTKLVPERPHLKNAPRGLSVISPLKEDWDMFDEFVRPRSKTLRYTVRSLLLFVLLPSLFIAFIVFYVFDNPPTGKWQDGIPPEGTIEEDLRVASGSWWVLFLGVRIPLMFVLAQVTELFLVQYVVTQSPIFARLLGPGVALFFSQSQGWPCVLFFFGFYDFILLYGRTEFHSHWLFYQDAVDLFNATNPAGDVVYRQMYARFLTVFLVIGFSVTFKRLWTGRHLGRRLVAHYGEQLAQCIDEILLLISISFLSRNQVKNAGLVLNKAVSFDVSRMLARNWMSPTVSGPPEQETAESARAAPAFESTTRLEIMEMLDEWDEPKKKQDASLDDVSIKDILQFRQAAQSMETEFPFSVAFGPASTRKLCLQSAEAVYFRLLKRQQEDQTALKLETLTRIAMDKHGIVDKEIVKQLVRVFHPDKDGYLSMLDWCKSVDAVYRKMRMLGACIDSASQVERAFEKIINCAFYLVLGAVCLQILSVDVWQLFLALSSIIVAFAFMIGTASSTYFEGILLVLCRKPYDVGDRIAVGDVNMESDPEGTSSWIVEGIDLFKTTVRFVATREVATLANGSLARSRIINMNRSDKAQVRLLLKFSVDEPFSKIKILKKAVEKFAQDRPQEWVEMTSFRSRRVESDLGYIEYVITLKHRESWQKTLAVLESKARVSSLCLELQKQLEMRYTAPALPVDLAVGTTKRQLDREDYDGSRGTASVELPTMDKSFSKTPGSDTVTQQMREVLDMFENKKSK